MTETEKSLELIRPLEDKIYLIRGQKVMLDADLAEVYGVETKVLNQAVKRNRDRFPEDFMFQLTEDELESLRSQIVTSNETMRSQFATSNKNMRSQFATASKRGGRRYLPFAFTEHGAVMLASVLKSPTAIEASIQVVRAFVRLRMILAEHKELAAKVEALEKKMDGKFAEQDEKILSILKIIKQFIETPVPARRQIGYVTKK